MILSTHGVIGGALASITKASPPVALVIGFASHFVFDTIPHWDYKLNSFKRHKDNPLHNDIELGREFLIDLTKIGSDALLGLIIPLAIVWFRGGQATTMVAVACGAIGGMLPDFLQFVYFKIRREPLTSLQRFHGFIHAKRKITDWRVGLGLQVLLMSAVALSFWF